MDQHRAAELFIQFGKVTGPASQLLARSSNQRNKPKPAQIMQAFRHLATSGVPYDEARDATVTMLRWHSLPVPQDLM